MIYEQTSFDAGINLLTSDMQIDPKGYRWLMNGRQRLGYLEANKKNIEIDTIPSGKKHAIIGVGNILIVFVEGKAYYQKDGDTFWTNIPGFSMDTIADRYYVQAIPASSFNFLRKNDSISANNPIVIDADFAINGTPAAILVQDNVNQPQVIIYNETTQSFYARITNNYNDWTITDHEYVPIGKQMMFKNGILFLVSRDGKSILRSVSGRPLDFMVNVDQDGDKLVSEYNGGAHSVSFAFDFEDITCLKDTDAEDVFIIGTKFNTRLIILDYSRTIFGEPTFRQVSRIEAGVVNQESLVQILGDYVFVDFENIKSFNAVLQLKNEGRNSIFSLNLAAIFKGIKQKEPCCCIFDNYSLFYVKTLYGNLIAVYDNLHQKWISFDLTTTDRVKQFAFTDNVTETKLYCITHHDELFQMYASDERELAQLMTRSFTPAADLEHKSQTLKPLFKGGSLTGELTAIEYVDEQLSDRVESEFLGYSAGVNYPVMPPIIPSNRPVMKHDTLVFHEGLAGKKIAFILQWNTDSKLHGFVYQTNEIQRETSLGQQAQILKDTYGPNS